MATLCRVIASAISGEDDNPMFVTFLGSHFFLPNIEHGIPSSLVSGRSGSGNDRWILNENIVTLHVKE